MSENVTASETISEWCAVENMSKAAFYSLKRHNPDLVPQLLEVPGTRIVRVIESHDAWRARVAEAMKRKQARLERERRKEIATIAGKAAAASAAHVSKRPQAKSRRGHKSAAHDAER